MSAAEAWDDHEQHLIGDEDEIPERLGDMLDVDRTIRALLWRRRKIEQAEMMAQATIDRARDYLETQRRRFDTSWLEDKLRAYHEARLAEDPKAKTLAFPAGTLSARKGQPEWVIDDDAFLSWAQDYATDLVRVKHEVDRSAVKRTLTPDERGVVVDGSGEIVPGVHVEPARVSFKVKAGDQ